MRFGHVTNWSLIDQLRDATDRFLDDQHASDMRDNELCLEPEKLCHEPEKPRSCPDGNELNVLDSDSESDKEEMAADQWEDRKVRMRSSCIYSIVWRIWIPMK